jgi:shikimate dehydrogenase
VLLDVAYGSGITSLTNAWTRGGGAAADGLDLLLWQAVDQVRLMTGEEPPVAAMRAALQAETGAPGP